VTRLPHVPFELRGFLLIVGFLLDHQHRGEAIDAKYVTEMRNLELLRAARARPLPASLETARTIGEITQVRIEVNTSAPSLSGDRLWPECIPDQLRALYGRAHAMHRLGLPRPMAGGRRR